MTSTHPIERRPLGMREFPRQHGPAAEIVAGLRAFTSTDLSDAMNGAFSMDSALRPAYAGMPRFAGTAVTVAAPTGAVSVRTRAMDLAGEGDVLVVNVQGVSSFAVLGGILASRLRDQGLAGVVIDGCVRDIEEIEEAGLPVLARGTCIRRPPKEGPGEVNVPVACAGALVCPGDVVVADRNGAVAVPAAFADEVLAEARRRAGQTATSRSAAELIH
ncbi:MAG: RraA family protein [Herbiconiux sp.]|uniref:RraA family protein n=1 Tax=Herbiconiux sp. TaxID=1871186 RepID=UPI0012057C6C|nr:RraA family protein [Herbiconiux sp.]TAJ46922.1 MAG: RraA family protein [Herbiconiux sp.]